MMGTRNEAAAVLMDGWEIPSSLSERSQGIYYALLRPIWEEIPEQRALPSSKQRH